MAHTDPIADMLTRIRNASMVKKVEVVLPHSKLKEGIAKILQKEGFIRNVEVMPSSNNPKYNELKLTLKYDNNIAAVQHIKRISKPGQRVYKSKDQLPVVLNNFGFAIISTSKGLMTSKMAKKEGLGGEIICEVD